MFFKGVMVHRGVLKTSGTVDTWLGETAANTWDVFYFGDICQVVLRYVILVELFP